MYKRFCIFFICIVLVLLSVCSGIVFLIDPFTVYRADSDCKNIIYQNPFYQNIGIAKYADFDTLITGSSMTQNFRANRFDDAFGCHAVRLSFDGGYTPDYISLLDAVFCAKPSLKTLYFGLDNYLITSDTELSNQPVKIPAYQTSSNPFLKVNYLLNKDVLFNNTRVYFGYKSSPSYNFYEMHAWGTDERDPNLFSAEKLLKGVKPISLSDSLPADAYLNDATNLFNELEPFIRDHPNTQFVFFAPPYSIIYWYELHQTGKLNPTISALSYVYGRLLSYDNVRVFYFQDNLQKITDLDQYKDKSHYCTAYNTYMLDCFQNGEKEITSDNYQTVLHSMQNCIDNFDFNSFFRFK